MGTFSTSVPTSVASHSVTEMAGPIVEGNEVTGERSQSDTVKSRNTGEGEQKKMVATSSSVVREQICQQQCLATPPKKMRSDDLSSSLSPNQVYALSILPPFQKHPGPGLHSVLPPLFDFLTPSYFGLRLKERKQEINEMQDAMIQEQPPRVPGWKPMIYQTLAMCYQGVCYRGVVVSKIREQYLVYRLDLGDMVSVEKKQLRRLPTQHLAPPPGCLLCCMKDEDIQVCEN